MALFLKSAHLVAELLTTQQVEMQMLHALAAVDTAVGAAPETILQTQLAGDHGNHLENVGHHTGVVGGDGGGIRIYDRITEWACLSRRI